MPEDHVDPYPSRPLGQSPTLYFSSNKAKFGSNSDYDLFRAIGQ